MDRGLLVGAGRTARRGETALERVPQSLARLRLPEPLVGGGVGAEVLLPVRNTAILGEIARFF